MNGELLLVLSVLMMLASLALRLLGGELISWATPLFLGGIAAAALGLYQRWWSRNVFR